jgi:hypothetical protein
VSKEDHRAAVERVLRPGEVLRTREQELATAVACVAAGSELGQKGKIAWQARGGPEERGLGRLLSP